jgi:hypothetical protein
MTIYYYYYVLSKPFQDPVSCPCSSSRVENNAGSSCTVKGRGGAAVGAGWRKNMMRYLKRSINTQRNNITYQPTQHIYCATAYPVTVIPSVLVLDVLACIFNAYSAHQLRQQATQSAVHGWMRSHLIVFPNTRMVTRSENNRTIA